LEWSSQNSFGYFSKHPSVRSIFLILAVPTVLNFFYNVKVKKKFYNVYSYQALLKKRLFVALKQTFVCTKV
jgi:hypothetical protein